eukprot:366463-Chlamydomonas_euryale.AAC.13
MPPHTQARQHTSLPCTAHFHTCSCIAWWPGSASASSLACQKLAGTASNSGPRPSASASAAAPQRDTPAGHACNVRLLSHMPVKFTARRLQQGTLRCWVSHVLLTSKHTERKKDDERKINKATGNTQTNKQASRISEVLHGLGRTGLHNPSPTFRTGHSIGSGELAVPTAVLFLPHSTSSLRPMSSPLSGFVPCSSCGRSLPPPPPAPHLQSPPPPRLHLRAVAMTLHPPGTYSFSTTPSRPTVLPGPT